jgi:hypothetical protein
VSRNYSATIRQPLPHSSAAGVGRPYGIYECVSLLRAGARTRSLENVGCSLYIHFDIDLRTLEESYVEARQKLTRALPLWVEIRDSGGGGFHLIIWLKEPAEAETSEFDRINAARSALTHILCADKAAPRDE